MQPTLEQINFHLYKYSDLDVAPILRATYDSMEECLLCDHTPADDP